LLASFSGREECSTPAWLFRELDREFRFTCDVAASAENAKCRLYYSREEDGLSQQWTGVCWCNPPYSRIAPWIEKAYLTAAAGSATVVCLVPVWSDRDWWHRWALLAEIRFIRGRLQFGNHRRGTAPFPLAVLVFGPSLPPDCRGDDGEDGDDGEPDFTVDIDPVDPQMPGWIP
jgi:phage N-6-adenine-methyltransferase